MIELKNVSFSYAHAERAGGLRNISLTIHDGEVVLLCGESGCGKTTLTRLVNGLIPHYHEGELSGEVIVNGLHVSHMPLYETAKLVGSVFQNPRSQFFNVDTTSELAFGCENMGLPEAEINERIGETLGEFRLEALMDKSIFALSGGEKQKIACASVSVCRPAVFVLDEPSSNLDKTAVEDLRKMLAIWKGKGRTIIIAEHRLYYLRGLADRIVYLKDGRIEREFTAAELEQTQTGALSAMGLRPLCLNTLKMRTQTMPAEQKRLTLSNFVYSYTGRRPILEIDSLSIPMGSAVAVVGPNGAGKSTFARCLCGLNGRFKGEIAAEGGTSRGKALLKRCYMVMQDVNHQLFAESVLDDVLISMKEQNAERAEEILSALDLLPLKELHPMSLSGGQKQRVAIAGAIASGKEIIVFDEPTSGLDLRHMREVAGSVQRLRETGKTLIIISHDLEFIMESCTHVLRLDKGKVTDSYPLDETGEVKLTDYFLNRYSETEPEGRPTNQDRAGLARCCNL